jgi:mono/diheme cytochrome c family protein
MRSRGLLRKLLRPVVWTLALSMLSGCKPLDDTMVFIFGRSMRNQRSFDPYENTRPAPENSIPFADGNDPGGEFEVNVGQPEEGADIPMFTQDDLGTPGVGDSIIQSLVNPTDPTDPRALARGQELYMRFCVVCHGPEGIGTGAYIAQWHPVLPAYNLSGPQVAGYSDQYIYAMIRVGRGLMPEYGSRISHYDRWHVVDYVRQLQRQHGNR